jgi:alcohol dehydrogenase class IV
MKDFDFLLPTRILFGNGKFNILGEEVSQLGKRALIVTYPSTTLEKWLDKAISLLADKGVSVVVYREVETNPDHMLINRGGELARTEKCDVVIGLGGGSAIDAAKGIAVVATENRDIWEIYEGAPVTQETLPVVAIPSTAGTGTEATFFTVVSHRELKQKEGFALPQFYPKLSIVDPLLTIDLPPHITAQTGLDALSHAIEAYYCKFSTPIVDALAVQAIELVSDNLRKAVYDGKDQVARYNMMLANTLAGMAITQSDSCLAHVIGEAVGGVYNLGHGLSVALCLPATMEYNAIASMEKFAIIAELMGEDISHLSLREAARQAPATVRKLIRDVGLPLGLKAIGVDDLSKVKELVNRPGWDESSPRPAGPEDFDLLLKACMEPAMSYWALEGH